MSAPRPATRVRRPAVAGMFYPGDGDALAAMVDGLLAEAALAPTVARTTPPPRALIVPHAGFVYSGPIAARAYAALRDDVDRIRRVVVAGPAHRVLLDGVALPAVEAYQTPLGVVPVDTEACARLAGLTGAVVDDRPGADEHSLEVQLPFVQRILGERWALVPLVVGHARTEDVSRLLDVFWDDDETLIVISTDLSHYHDYATAQQLDRATAAAIVARDVDRLVPERACGAYPLRGLLDLARRRDATVELLDLRSSGDTAGDPDRVVGYGAFALR